MAEQNLEKTIFLHAIGLASPADRAAYLDEACRDNPQLRAELDALLAAHRRLGDAPSPPLQPELTWAFAPPTEAAGAVIGPYKLLVEVDPLARDQERVSLPARLFWRGDLRFVAWRYGAHWHTSDLQGDHGPGPTRRKIAFSPGP
jgi:hypothetical protein